jgi:hypothetical protein
MKDYNRGEDSGRTAHENGQTIKINKKNGNPEAGVMPGGRIPTAGSPIA